MSIYTFGDVLRFNDLTRNALKRWTQVGLIRPDIVPGEGLRRFTARNLVEAGVIAELRGFGMPEALLQRVVDALNRYWDEPDTRTSERPDAVTWRQCSVLWIALIRWTSPPDDEIHETLTIRFVDVPTLTALLTEDPIPETGIAVPLGRIIADLERRTGARFDFTRATDAAPVPPADLPQHVADLERQLAESRERLAQQFTHALTAALTAATGDAPIGEEKVAAIINAVTTALAESPV